MEVAPYLLFLGNCKEAFEFYEKALGGKLDLMTYGQSPESGKMPAAMQNQVIHARLIRPCRTWSLRARGQTL